MDRETEVQRMTEASMRALDEPGGEELLQAMVDGELGIEDGLVALLLLSGDYEPR